MTSKICGNCCHYLSGQLENPCAKNPKYVGYLREGCGSWSETEEEENKVSKTRVCNKCGKELPVIMFARNSFLCKNCKTTTKPKRRRNGSRG